MSINKRIRQLKKKLDDSRLKPGKYINPPRNEIIEFVFSGPHEDWTITDLSEAIGLSTPTIYKWKKLVMDEQKSMFLPVVPQFSPPPPGAITFESPHGHLLHGLSVDDAIHVLQALS
jgi:hypothetical protein